MTVGRKEDLLDGEVACWRTWCWADGPVAGPVLAQCSAHGEPRPGTLAGDRLVWDAAQPRVAPGQSVVFYDGDQVLGGAIAR